MINVRVGSVISLLVPGTLLVLSGPVLADSARQTDAKQTAVVYSAKQKVWNEAESAYYTKLLSRHNKNMALLKKRSADEVYQFRQSEQQQEAYAYWQKRARENNILQARAEGNLHRLNGNSRSIASVNQWKNILEEKLSHLQKKYPEQQLSPIRWRAITHVYGAEAAEQFFLQKHSIDKPLSYSRNIKPWYVVFVKGNVASYRQEKPVVERHLSQLKQVHQISHRVFFASSFNSLDQQAQELRTILELAKLKHRNIVLISSGFGSTIVNRLVDLYPTLPYLANVRGWINIDGRIYGYSWFDDQIERTFQRKSRGVASYQETIADQEIKLKQQLFAAQTAVGHIQLQMPPELPVVNLLRQLFDRKTEKHLAERLILSGKSYHYKPAELGRSIETVLSDFKFLYDKDADQKPGIRDLASDE